MTQTDNLFTLPHDLPVPQDDGAAGHLRGAALSGIPLPATDGREVDLSALAGRTVVYAYPRTGEPGMPVPADWDAIPGARGCTPQSCGFRDLHHEFATLDTRVFGLSTQSTAYQREVVDRLHLPFPILSDADLTFTRAMGLPTFTFDGMTLLKRLTLVIRDGTIEHLLYPVFPPDRSAGDVLTWLRAHPE